jgi:hypothetical protein
MTLSMTCEQFEDILPDLLDDDTMLLPPAARLHLEGCADCKALCEDLTGIRSAAAGLPPITPSRDLWAGIEARIRTPIVPLVEGMPVMKPRRQISLRSAAIAAGVLAIVNAGVSYTYMYLKRPEPVIIATESPMPAPVAMRTTMPQAPIMGLIPVPTRPVLQAPRRGSTVVLAANSGIDEVDDGPDGPQQQPRRREAAKLVYNREINRLRAIVDSNRSKLDPATVAVLDRNLRIIDTAIDQCNLALQRDSSSTFLIEQLNNVYQTKVKLLQNAAALVSRE